MLHFVVRNGQHFPLLLEMNNTFRIVTETYLNSDHTINFFVVKVFMVVLQTMKHFLKLTRCQWVGNDYMPKEKDFILLLEMNNISLCC